MYINTYLKAFFLIIPIFFYSFNVSQKKELIIVYPKISIEKTLQLAKDASSKIDGVKYARYCDKQKAIMFNISESCKLTDVEIADKIMVDAYLGTKYSFIEDITISHLLSNCQ
jgi:hypothetical protein